VAAITITPPVMTTSDESEIQGSQNAPESQAMLFKPKFPDKKTGIMKETRCWYARINGRRYPLGVTDKRVAHKKASELLLQIEGGNDPRRQKTALKVSIIEHLDGFEQSLRVKGCCDQHITQILARLDKVFNGCSITCLADARWEVIEGWLANQQQIGALSAQTRKHYAVHLRQFGGYLVRQDVLPSNPFKKISTNINVEVDRRIRRRALTVEEFQTLLESVAKSKRKRCHLKGSERRLLYWLAGATGLRRGELGSLTPESFSFASVPPTVTVTARRTKNRKTAILPIREDLAQELQRWVSKKPSGKILFPIAERPTNLMIRADLEDAGIESEVLGLRCDFHALRVTMISHLAINGVPLAVAQKLARHSTPVLTANVYTQLDLSDLKKAVESVPSLGANGSAAAKGIKASRPAAD
jgi:integrase